MADRQLAVRGNQPGIAAVPESEADELSLIRKTYAADLTNDEFGILVADARHRGLSVVKREVVGIKFKGRMMPYVTLAGARALAERSGKYAGGQGPFFCGPDGTWVEVWLDERKPPTAAKFIVHRHDQIFPIVGIATWKERNQPSSPTWQAMPSVMLGKVSEMDALRRARLIDDVPVYVGGDADGEMPPKIGAMRHLHGVGRERGLDHGELRTVVAAIKPGISSMTEEAVGARDLGAAADLIDALDDEAVEAIVAAPERMAEPAGAVVAPWEGEQDPVDEEDRATVEADPKTVETWLRNIDRAKDVRRLDGLVEVLTNAGLGAQPDIKGAIAIKRAELRSA
jgi:hypothetical protein